MLPPGTGFHIRDRNEQDVEGEVDIDGEDEAVFGDAQFTEGDILGPNEPQQAVVDQDLEVEIEGDDDEVQRDRKTLRDLVAEGKVVTRRPPHNSEEGIKEKMEEIMGIGDADKMNLAVSIAQRKGNSTALIIALENKIEQLVGILASLCKFTTFDLTIL